MKNEIRDEIERKDNTGEQRVKLLEEHRWRYAKCGECKWWKKIKRGKYGLCTLTEIKLPFGDEACADWTPCDDYWGGLFDPENFLIKEGGK